MTDNEARELIRRGIDATTARWADIGAGTGTFTRALMDILDSGVIYAVDKNPHMLWDIRSSNAVQISVHEGDFNQRLNLPELDGILMANTLHYASDPEAVLVNVTRDLKQGGVFILVEYESKTPRPPWVPYPVPYARFEKLCRKAGLTDPEMIGTAPSHYGYEHIYAARSARK